MKRSLFLVFVLLFSLGAFVCHAESAQKKGVEDKNSFDVRNVRWGMSQAEVRKQEAPKKGMLLNGGNTLVYNLTLNDNVTLLGKEARVAYDFDEDKLIRCVYVVAGNYSNVNEYFDYYQSIVKAFKAKYGNPLHGTNDFLKKLYKNNPEQWSKVYADGDVTTETVWQADNTNIFTLIADKELTITVSVLYSSIEFDK